MKLRQWLAATAVAMAVVVPAAAESLPVPTVEYSADRVMESAQGSMTTKVYSAGGGKERTEMNMGGMDMVTILRPDKKVMWMLMPMQNMYSEMDLSKAPPHQPQGGPHPPRMDENVEITKVGSETIDGHATTKYKMVMKDKSAGGFIWITEEGIPLRIDMLAKDGGDKTRMKIELKNLQIGKQDAALFELPSGYSKMPAFGGMGPGMMSPGMGGPGMGGPGMGGPGMGGQGMGGQGMGGQGMPKMPNQGQ